MKRMYSSNTLWAISLLLALTLGCKKSNSDGSSPAPQATDCLLSKAIYGDGTYTLYTYNADGRVATVSSYGLDQNGKVQTSATPDKLTYNAQGLLDQVTWADGTGYEQYSWTNGALSKIEAIKGGTVVYRIEVTTNANKMITGMKSINVAKDPNAGFDYTTTFTLDAQGRYTNLTATGPDGVYFVEDITAYDSSIKSAYAGVKGYPVYTDVNINYYGLYIPVNGYAATKEVYRYAYDSNGKYIGLQKVDDYTFTYKVNAANSPISITSSDAVSNITGINNMYTYTNCQ